ncbi:Uncharacterised protein [Mycobacterium tuberculosis]|nr:Uncharacterised protein [Mycobacterium tuberculosis]CKR66414.1 Uncharacterised protein [Mycobacterium tuberculosis]CNV47463.1 Uncharacterised protein [Mycobacterium tuberculosis]CNV80246.1 Uncharacterised protein [Mycobacterium tuberculosis]CNZ85076.1 Uncharacterised protein [Mycobacterium tuberculosis]
MGPSRTVAVKPEKFGCVAGRIGWNATRPAAW